MYIQAGFLFSLSVTLILALTVGWYYTPIINGLMCDI